jgi:hypothetical protein
VVAGRWHDLPRVAAALEQRLVDTGADLTPERDREEPGTHDQDKFVPFIVETGDIFNRARPPVPAQDPAGSGGAAARKRGWAALRGMSRALSLQQGYMLARIVAEIH